MNSCAGARRSSGPALMAHPAASPALSGAGNIVIDTPDDVDRLVTDSAWRRHQMPAYHLMADDRTGITLVNIGVGPSNAKTICDHLAVLRPEAWLMIGHCGGLRPSQRIGDYVLAHAYLRDDHVLDDVLPPEIPVPAIAEVQVALAKAAEIVSGQSGEELKRRLRTGTIVTTDDRNWELRYSRSALRFSLSRAVGIDMESATIAAQGYRFRVPYGTLAMRVGQAAPWRTQAARPGEPLLRTRDQRTYADRDRGMRTVAAGGRTAPQPQIARVRRTAVPLDGTSTPNRALRYRIDGWESDDDRQDRTTRHAVGREARCAPPPCPAQDDGQAGRRDLVRRVVGPESDQIYG